MRFTRCIGLLVAAVGAVVVAPAARAAEPALEKARIAYLGLTCEAPMFVADEKGFFKDEGVEVEFVKLDWNSLKEGLTFGRVDATHHLVMFLLKPIEQGLDIRITAGSHTGCLRVQAKADSPLTSVGELKGKRIGVPAIGSPPFLFASRTLVAAGVNPTKDVEWRVFPPAELGLALDRGLVDAIGTAEPIGTLVAVGGKVKTLADQAVDAPYKDEYCCVVAVSGKIARENPALAGKVTRGILKGAKWVQANPLASAQLSVESGYIGAKPEVNAHALSKLAYIPSIRGGHDAVISASAEMKAMDMLKPSTDPADLARRAFLPLDNVTEEWLDAVEVEKVAGGDALRPLEEVLDPDARAVAVSGAKSCCDVAP